MEIMTDEPQEAVAAESKGAPEDILEALEDRAGTLKDAITEADEAMEGLNKAIRQYNERLAGARQWLEAKGMVGLAHGSDFSDLDEIEVHLPSEDQEHADLFRDQLED